VEATEMRTSRPFVGYIRLAKNINTGIRQKLVVITLKRLLHTEGGGEIMYMSQGNDENGDLIKSLR
jgi:hypothetical protein